MLLNRSVCDETKMPFTDKTFDFTKISHEAIEATLLTNNINLSVYEALTIQQMLQRPPTLTECILWSVQNSEHCSYKSTRQYLQQLPTEGTDIILGPCEDSGIISIGRDKHGHRYGIVVSHESHNHPSQIVPFEGAATGVGGNIRDVCCMGAEVIALSNSLRFGEINRTQTKWLQENVVSGIASYGNAVGVPNIGGDLYYDPGYNNNCLVTIVTLGLIREDHIIHSAAPKHADGYDLILIGKATDHSGFAGASFASAEIEVERKSTNYSAVQEPNAFLGRHLLKANYALFKIMRDQGLLEKVGFKDLGAGGIACASIELANNGAYGAVIDIEKIPTTVTGLHPAVILCSETQERYMWVAPPEITPLILHHYNETFALPIITEKAQAAVIGKIIVQREYIVRYQNTEVVRAQVCDIMQGFCYNRPYRLQAPPCLEPTTSNLSFSKNFNKILLACLEHENIASRESIFETYDKQVQGRTLVEAGVADAGVLQPFNDDEFPKEIQNIGLVLACAHNPRYCKIDPYWGAINAVVEAMRNVTAVGAKPIAVTDCLCFGNPEIPEQMAEFVAAVSGIADSCKMLQIPVISGNVSLYNGTKNIPIPSSPIISCLGKLDDVVQIVTTAFKKINSCIVMVGPRQNELGGSVFYALNKQLGANLPKPDCKLVANQITAVHEAMIQQLVLAAHDISDGGIAVALAEMSFPNHIGCCIKITGDLSDEIKLWSETSGFVLEADPINISSIKKILASYNVEFEIIGYTTSEPFLKMQTDINLSIKEAKNVWQKSLRCKLGRSKDL